MSQSSEELIEDVQIPIETTDPNAIFVSDRSDLPERLDRILITDLKFIHIYNGMIMNDDSFHGMAEFKIRAPKIQCDDSEFEFRFIFSNHKCGWFRVDGGSSQLVGPFEVDGERFHDSGERRVRLSESTEFELIENVDNDSENLILSDDIPKWMLRDLVRSVSVVENKIV
jgi:hypothetical protein